MVCPSFCLFRSTFIFSYLGVKFSFCIVVFSVMKFPLSLMILPHILPSLISRLRSLFYFCLYYSFQYTSAHPFIFNLSESLCFRYVSCIEHRDGFCFFSQSENPFLLIGELRPFTFIDKCATLGLFLSHGFQMSIVCVHKPFHYELFSLCPPSFFLLGILEGLISIVVTFNQRYLYLLALQLLLPLLPTISNTKIIQLLFLSLVSLNFS